MESAVPGNTRPGGRTKRVQSAVFGATLSVLAELGYAGLSIDRIAERSGVHKTTIYRRWQSRDAVLAAAMNDVVEQLLPIPTAGRIEEDLRAFGRGLVDVLTNRTPPVAGVVRALFSDAANDPAVAEIKRNLLANRHQAAASMVDAARERGEFPPDADSREVVGLVAAQLYYRKLVTEEPLNYDVAERAADAAITATRGGACRKRAPIGRE